VTVLGHSNATWRNVLQDIHQLCPSHPKKDPDSTQASRRAISSQEIQRREEQYMTSGAICFCPDFSILMQVCFFFFSVAVFKIFFVNIKIP
jgi:hypothetical protein